MHFKMTSAICFNLDQSKVLLSVDGLRVRDKNESFPPLPLKFLNANFLKQMGE